MTQAATCELNRAIDLDGVWAASLRLMDQSLAHHSCSLMLGIDNLEPRTARHHVVQARSTDYTPATSLSISRPFLRANPQTRLYTYSQVALVNPRVLERRMEQREPLEEWAEFVHLAFWDDDRLMAVMSIRRAPDNPSFSSEELDFLQQIHPLVDAGLYRLCKLESERACSLAMQSMLQHVADPALLFDAQGHLVFATEHAIALWRRWLREWPWPRYHADDGTDDEPSLDALPALDAQLGDGVRYLSHARIPGFSAKIEPVRPSGSVLSRPSYSILSFNGPHVANPVVAVQRRDPAVLRQLSPSERKVAILLCDGLCNDDIAQQLCRSRRTVESQLSSIYRKCEVSSRTQLMKLLQAR